LFKNLLFRQHKDTLVSNITRLRSKYFPECVI